MELILGDGVSTGSTTCNTCGPDRSLSLSKGEGPYQLVSYSYMEEAFAYLAAHAKPGDVCLLSPAASSYDQYKNFEERGAKFKALATHFAETKKDE